jgi:RNA polymerase sigma factor (sigma-70 family)
MHTTTNLAGEAMAGGPAGRSLRAKLFERVMDRIHRYFVRLVWDAQDVEDCVQKTLLRLEQSLQSGSYNPHHSFNRWLWIKAHSVYVEHCRASTRRPCTAGEADEAASGAGAGGTGAVDARLDAEAVLGHLRTELDPEDFEAFVMRLGEGHSVTDIAAITGCDRKTARKRIERGRRAALRMLGGTSET